MKSWERKSTSTCLASTGDFLSDKLQVKMTIMNTPERKLKIFLHKFLCFLCLCYLKCKSPNTDIQ